MTDERDPRVDALIKGCHLHHKYAHVLVETGGQCEICGIDVVWDRFGYSIGRVLHLLTSANFREEITENPANWALACFACYEIKGEFDPAKDEQVDPETLVARREEFLNATREHIYLRRAREYDPTWHRIKKILWHV